MGKEKPGVAQRLLSAFAEVERREVAGVLLLTLNIFLVLLAYYLLKVVREPLILASGGPRIFGRELAGAELKSYAAAGQAVLLIAVVRAYAALARRFGRMPLTAAMHLFFASNLFVFYALARAGVAIGLPFYLWVGCFSLTIIAQFWSFANDVYTPDQGKRLFAIVGVGSSAGAVAGAKAADMLLGPIGPYTMMLVAAAILVVCVGVFYVVHRREAARHGDGAPGGDAPPGGAAGGFALLARDRYLLLIATLTMLFSWVNTNGEYILDRTLVETASIGVEAPPPAPLVTPAVHPLPQGAPVYLADREGARVLPGTVAAVAGDGRYRVEAGGQAFEGARDDVFPRTEVGRRDALKLVVGSFKASFFLWVNVLGVVIQLFLVSRIFKYLGVRFALFILPAIALFGYAALAFAPALGIVRVAKIAENSADYSVQNTARHALFLPVSREAKFSAKAAIDTFVVRTGDVLSAVLVFAGTSASLATKHFAMVNLALVAAWLGVVVAIAREHRRRA